MKTPKIVIGAHFAAIRRLKQLGNLAFFMVNIVHFTIIYDKSTKSGFMDISPKDEQMISLLRGNARLSVSEIARRLSVSRTAAQMRLEKLERNGVIDGYTVRLSSRFLKDRVSALVMIKSPPGNRPRVENALSKMRQLTSLYSISGVFDLYAIVSAPSVGELDAAIDAIGRLDGVDDTMSSVILAPKIDR